jgi:ribosomal protein S8
MFITRHILSSIVKAVKNNQKLVIIPKKLVNNFSILKILTLEGFIQSFEIRGNYLYIMLRQVY